MTVTGKDHTGIVASVSVELARLGVNILDISQTIVQGFFNMMMITDANQSEKPFADLAKGLEELGNEMGLTIRCQHEDIFNKMHRI